LQNFIFDQPAYRVIFGVGALARLREEVERLGLHRPLFISTPARRWDSSSGSVLQPTAIGLQRHSAVIGKRLLGEVVARRRFGGTHGLSG